MYETGLIGPFKDYLIAYQAGAQEHDSQQMFLSAHKKRHNYKQYPGFEKIYPKVYQWATLGREPLEEPTNYHERMFKDMVQARGADAPDWAIIKKEEEDG